MFHRHATLQDCTIAIDAGERIIAAMEKLNSPEIKQLPEVLQLAIARMRLILYHRTWNVPDFENSLHGYLLVKNKIQPGHELYDRYHKPIDLDLIGLHRGVCEHILVLESEYRTSKDIQTLNLGLDLARRAYEFLAIQNDFVAFSSAAYALCTMKELYFERTGDRSALEEAEGLSIEAVRKTKTQGDSRVPRIRAMARIMAQIQLVDEGQINLARLRKSYRSIVFARRHPSHPIFTAALEEARFLLSIFSNCNTEAALDAAINLLEVTVYIATDTIIPFSIGEDPTGDRHAAFWNRHDLIDAHEPEFFAAQVEEMKVISTLDPNAIDVFVEELQITKDVSILNDQLSRRMKVLPRLHVQSLPAGLREARVRSLSTLSCLAAAIALESGFPMAKALRRLERGRMLIFSTFLERRQEEARLKEAESNLWQRLTTLETVLDVCRLEDTSDSSDLDISTRTAIRISSLRLRACIEIDRVIEEIRKKDTYHRFRKQPLLQDILQATEGGTLVYINPTDIRSDALILRNSSLEVLQLPCLRLSDARKQESALQQALRDAARRPRLKSVVGRANGILKKHLKWMWDTFVRQILDYLGLLLPDPPSVLPRIWWICCDVLSSFPIHAAGDFDEGFRQNALRYCVSSYATTIKTLLFARRKLSLEFSEDEQIMIFAMQVTPESSGQRIGNLDTDGEVKAIWEQVPSTIQCRSRDSPIRDQAVSLMGSVISHFACHGFSDPLNPSNSRLLLADHQIAPLTVAEISERVIKTSKLAYLSACSSAVNLSQGLADEGLNLASAFQLAGFPSVIGTLWQAFDQTAVKMAGKFYRHLFRGHSTLHDLTGEQIARALHAASVELSGEDWIFPIRWASYVHFGD